MGNRTVSRNQMAAIVARMLDRLPAGWTYDTTVWIEAESHGEAFGSHEVGLWSNTDMRLACTSPRVDVTVVDQIAHVVIELVVVNQGLGQAEAVYLLPLHESASISQFSYWVDGKEIRGEILERREARRRYDTVVRSNRDPGLLEWAGCRMFSARVFPIGANKPTRIRIEYVQACDYDDGTVRFDYPLPTSNDSLTSSVVDFNATIADGRGLGDVVLIGCAGDVAVDSAHSASVAAVASGDGGAVGFRYRITNDGPYLQTFSPKTDEGWIGPGLGREGHFLLTMPVPAVPRERTPAGRDVYVFVDTSASMGERGLGIARAFVAELVGRLGSTDRLLTGAFADKRFTVGLKLQNVDGDVRRLARVWADDLKLGRGATIGTAFETCPFDTSAGEGRAGREAMIVVVTDGLPMRSSWSSVGESWRVFADDADEILTSKEARGMGKTPVFSVAVGTRSDQDLLGVLAERTGGTVEQATTKAEAVAAGVRIGRYHYATWMRKVRIKADASRLIVFIP